MAPKILAETDDWILTVAGIPVLLPPPGVPYDSDDQPSPEDMGINDPNSIIYVNLRAKNVPEKFNERLKQLESMLNLTHQWLDIHAGIQTGRRKKEGQLPSDSSDESSWKRSDYRVKVVDTLLSENCAWIYNPHREDYSKYINVRKASFHLELLTNMIAGLALPTGIQERLEAGFKALGDLIVQTQTTSEHRAVWTLFHVFTYDSARDAMNASLRNINYSISQEMKNVAVGKAHIDYVDINFSFFQRDYNFNEDTWNHVKPEIEKFINDIATDQVRNPIIDDIPV
jgi:hypothetical protein